MSLFRPINICKDIKALYQTLWIIRKEKPDIIHCHSAKGGIVGRTAGFIIGIKTLYTPHAFSYLCTPSMIKRYIFLAVERQTRFNAYVLAYSKSERLQAVDDVGYSSGNVLVWHNAVPDASLEKGKAVGTRLPYICYVGRPCCQKNTLVLLDVIKKVLDRGCSLNFVLLGVGYHLPELEAMRARIADLHLDNIVCLVPWISHANCQEYVSKSLFYVSTALYEGLPLTVIEAMANGKAIVASDVAGNSDCAKESVNGFLLPLNVDVFADRIIRLVNDEDLRMAMGRKSREIFLDEFFIEKQILKQQKIYERCASE